MKKKSVLLILFILIAVSAVSAETLTVSTYYPAPFGAYDRLRLVPRTVAPPCTTALEGTVYYDDNVNRIVTCSDPGPDYHSIIGIWTQFNIDAANADVFLSDPVRAMKVGINTTTPQEDLHIAGGGQLRLEAPDVGIQMVTSGAGDEFKLGVDADDALEIQADTGSDWTYEANVMRIGNNGNVGIGTNIVSTPAENFLVNGDGVSSVTERINIENGGAGTARLRLTETRFRGGFLNYNSAAGEFHIGVHNSDDFNIGSDNAAVTIDRGTGDVLIGGGAIPVNPEVLNVNGGIKLRDDGANWGQLMVEYRAGDYYMVLAP